VRLEPSRLGALHLRAHARHRTRVHCIVDQCPLIEQRRELLAIHRVSDGLSQPGPHVGALAVADGGDQQVAQRLALEVAQC
jgi:hypothetical protein